MTEQTKKYLTTADQIMTALAQGKTVYVDDNTESPTKYKMVNGFLCVVAGIGNDVMFIGDGINTAAGYDTYTLEDAPFGMSAGKWVDDCGIERYVTLDGQGDCWPSMSANGVVIMFGHDGRAKHQQDGIQLVRKIGEW